MANFLAELLQEEAGRIFARIEEELVDEGFTAEGVQWTGTVRMYQGLAYFEHEVPGSWNGTHYYAIDGTLLAQADPDDVEAVEE